MSGDVHERIWKHLAEWERERAEWVRWAEWAMYIGFAAGFVAGVILGVVLA